MVRESWRLWLGFQAFTAMARVQSPVGELRPCKLHGMAKKKINKGWDFPGGHPGVKILCSQRRGPGFNPWLGN